MDFTSIDVETANPDLSSICQIGIVQFRDNAIAHRWKSYVRPDGYFDPMNVSIHGITESDVADAPNFSEVSSELDGYLTSSIVCHHTSFDRTAIHAAYARNDIAVPSVDWLDTARVVRRTWPERSRSGYGLGPVAEMLGIEFTHHDAEEDARVAGEILIHAISKSGVPLADWPTKGTRPITSSKADSSGRETRDGNPEGPLYGETVVFTGALSMLRRDASDLAAAAGCDVGGNVTKSTTLLVVGDQDVAVLAGHTKSSKHRKAEANIAKGQPIRILRESDFELLISTVAKDR